MPPMLKDILLKPENILKSFVILAAFASFLFSVSLFFQSPEADVVGRLNGIYVGLWVPSILALGALLLAKGNGDSNA